MRLLSVGGTRPQFVKMAVIARAIEEYNRIHPDVIEHGLLHTGQHRDPLMSDIFFDELSMPRPRRLQMYHTQRAGLQTAIMLAEVEAELLDWKPDAVLAYGDTNSTLSSALAAVKLHVPVVHVEAGLRSFNRRMQEETNRVITDHISDLLLCPTRSAVDQLHYEGLGKRAVFVGDVMLDAVEIFSNTENSVHNSSLSSGGYALLTLHRAETTDDPARLVSIFNAVRQIDLPVILPMHPRLKNRLSEGVGMGLILGTNIHLVEPKGYLEMLALQRHARFIMTDSGGVQKEAYFVGIPCLTLREETEWRETLHGGWNTLVGSDTAKIVQAARTITRNDGDLAREPRDLASFGGGNAGKQSVKRIVDYLGAA